MKPTAFALLAIAAAALLMVAPRHAHAQFAAYDIANGTETPVNSYTGTSISSSGNVIAVGAPYHDFFNFSGGAQPSTNTLGLVLLYQCTEGTTTNDYTCINTYNQTQAGYAGQGYGASVGISRAGSLLAVGCPLCEASTYTK